MANRSDAKQCNIPIPRNLSKGYDENTRKLGCTKTAAAVGMIRVWISLPDSLQRQMLGDPGPDDPYKTIKEYFNDYELTKKIRELPEEQQEMLRVAVGDFKIKLLEKVSLESPKDKKVGRNR